MTNTRPERAFTHEEEKTNKGRTRAKQRERTATWHLARWQTNELLKPQDSDCDYDCDGDDDRDDDRDDYNWNTDGDWARIAQLMQLAQVPHSELTRHLTFGEQRRKFCLYYFLFSSSNFAPAAAENIRWISARGCDQTDWRSCLLWMSLSRFMFSASIVCLWMKCHHSELRGERADTHTHTLAVYLRLGLGQCSVQMRVYWWSSLNFKCLAILLFSCSQPSAMCVREGEENMRSYPTVSGNGK